MANPSIDYFQDNLAQTLFPNPPVSCIKGGNQPGLLIQHHYQPEHTTFEHAHQQHIVSVPIRGTGWVERKVDGRVYKAYPTQGDIGIYPAQQMHQIRWKGNAEFIFLCLEPWLVAQAASQVGVDACLELVPHVKVQDLLIQQIGLTLKTELEADKLGNPLYVESLVTSLLFHLLKLYSSSKQQVASINSGNLSERQLTAVFK